MRRRYLFRFGIIVLLASGFIAWTVWPRGTSTISEKDAVAKFRDTTTVASKPASHSGAAQGSVAPARGVYRYRATGQEKVKFGPLPESTNILPASVTGAVATKPSGCFTFTLNLFKEHTEDSVFCGSKKQLTLTSYAKHQTIGAITATAKIRCDPGAFIETIRTTNDLRCNLSLEGGPFPVNAAFVGSATREDQQTMKINGATVNVTPVTVTFTFSTKVKGSWTEKMWFTDNHLPVRIKRTLDMNGPASFDERFDLTLESESPRT